MPSAPSRKARKPPLRPRKHSLSETDGGACGLSKWCESPALIYAGFGAGARQGFEEACTPASHCIEERFIRAAVLGLCSLEPRAKGFMGLEVSPGSIPLYARCVVAVRGFGGALLEGQSGHRGCERGWGGGWFLAVGNAVWAGVGVLECLSGRVRAVGEGGGGYPPPPPSSDSLGFGMTNGRSTRE